MDQKVQSPSNIMLTIPPAQFKPNPIFGDSFLQLFGSEPTVRVKLELYKIRFQLEP